MVLICVAKKLATGTRNRTAVMPTSVSAYSSNGADLRERGISFKVAKMKSDTKTREARQKRRTKRQCIPQAVQPRDERGRWTTGVAAVDEAETGKPFEAKLYRGEGDAPQEAARNRTPSQYGVGQYWSPNEEVARTYGPRVWSEIVRLENPYVLPSGPRSRISPN
jgi:hypothetical protein